MTEMPVWTASGNPILQQRFWEKMERQYQQREKHLKELSQPEVSSPLTYRNEPNLKGKEHIFKDIYTSIEAWQRLCKLFQSQTQEKEIE